ncbi:MAG: PTS sugar transporter subunit IIA, partial [Janthinobacterium lividum]
MSDLVGADDVIMGTRVRDKAELLRELSVQAASRWKLAEAKVLSSLATRERMGSTGLGRGFALPHAKLDG